MTAPTKALAATNVVTLLVAALGWCACAALVQLLDMQAAKMKGIR